MLYHRIKWTKSLKVSTLSLLEIKHTISVLYPSTPVIQAKRGRMEEQIKRLLCKVTPVCMSSLYSVGGGLVHQQLSLQCQGQDILFSVSRVGITARKSKWLCMSWFMTGFGWTFLIAQLVRPLFDSWVGKIRWKGDRLPTPVFLGFPCGSAGKDSTCNTGDLGSIPGLGRSPAEGKSYPLQYSGLENSMDCLVLGVYKVSDMTERFSLSPAWVQIPKYWQGLRRDTGLYHPAELVSS